MKRNIIAICGNKFHGKSLIANILVQAKGYKELTFAKPLKDICKILFGFTNEQLYGDEKEVPDKFWLKTPRFFMQKIGTDLFRKNFDENIWIKILEKKILDNTNDDIVISDIRFPNEISMLKRHGAIIIKVFRPCIENTDLHESEEYIKNFNCHDYEIINDSTISELIKKVLNICKDITYKNF